MKRGRRANRRRWSAPIGVVLGVLLCLVVAAPAQAQRPDQGVAVAENYKQLLELFGIADKPVDFVIVLDTSSSMAMGDDPFYPRVRDAYAGFIDAIRPNDHLSVLRFDTRPLPLFDGTMETPERRAQALSALPTQADGANTDIGSALSDTLDRLERPGGNEVQLVIFLTDGKQEPGPGSPYGSGYGPAWEPVHERAQVLEKNHQLWAYGAGLTNGQPTDVNLLGSVFARTKLVGLPPDQLPAFFREAIEKARIEQLRTPMTEEITKANVSSAVVPVGALGDDVTFDARFTTSTKKLPVTVEVKGVSVTDASGNKVRAELAEGPKTLLLGPGATSDPIRVVAHPTLVDVGRQFGLSTQSQSFKVDFDVDTVAEPHNLARVLLDIDTKVAHTPPPDPAALSRDVGISMRTVLIWFLILAMIVLLVLAVLAWLFKTPPLRGSLERKDGSLVPLKGTSQVYPDRKHPDADAMGASALFFTKRRKWRKVFVETKHPVVELERYKRFSVLSGDQRVTVGTKIQIGSAVVRWTPRSKGGATPRGKATSSDDVLV